MIVNLCQMLWLYFVLSQVSQPYHVLTFQIGSIILFLIVLLLTSSYQFVLLNVGACYFGDLPLENFIRHLFITFSKPFRLILELIDLLVGTKSRSPHYFFVLHIVSNFVFSILLICQVKQNLRFKDLYVTGLQKEEAF